MTTHESFTKRVRERMAKSGEHYSAARRALMEADSQPCSGGWTAQPQHSDEQVRERTGRGWDDWVAAIDAGPGRASGHAAIAAWLVDQGVDAWWAQGVTVGFERITGLRMPGQMPDGTFTVSRSRVVALPSVELRAMLLDDTTRGELLPGYELRLLSRPDVKAPRFEFLRGPEALGLVSFELAEASTGRTRLAVTQSKLLTYGEGELSKQLWSEWLTTLGDLSG